MSSEGPNYSNIKADYTPDMIEAGIPTPEKWKGLKAAMTIGSKGYTFDTLVEDAKKMIGYEVWEFAPPSIKLGHAMDAGALRSFCLTHGEDNPLFTDPDYGKNTKYGCQLMYPTQLHTVRYGMTHGVNEWGPYPISSLVSGLNWDFYDVIRVNTRFRTSMKMKDCFEKRGRTGRLCFYTTDLSFWDQRDQLIATGGGIYIDVGKSGEEAEIALEAAKKGEGMSKTMLYERPTYHYTDDEITKITQGYENEKRRGAIPLYWEDVNVGDNPPEIVKGPITFNDFTSGHRVSENIFVPMVQARLTKNPRTGWGEPTVDHHYDFNLCNNRGLPGPFDLGVQRMSMSAQLLNNWMGDDGFIRRLASQVRKPNYYGDTQWFRGEVVKKYKDTVGGVEYGAVDVVISVINQVGENTLPTSSTIYLPSHELGEVELPVPLEEEAKWKVITKKNVKDFINEIQTGETVFPFLPRYLGIITG